ncbi:MAG: hypothetical protein ACI90U_001236 [Pseudomonadales bacterium]|jgi:hypothetical protein
MEEFIASLGSSDHLFARLVEVAILTGIFLACVALLKFLIPVVFSRIENRLGLRVSAIKFQSQVLIEKQDVEKYVSNIICFFMIYSLYTAGIWLFSKCFFAIPPDKKYC